ncbi:MAG: LacI family DNA-binding transcriptional regulator [Lachnospiraceae bacterium]|nr:LacI family DNA-binding transcriptional regulator [Lachnospiraceae bacterium]
MTIYDISEKAGVSIATVSRVLNGSNNVSEKTKRKVLDVMQQYGYTPNAFARGLGLNTMKTIGLMCADSSDLYMAKAIYFVERLLRANGYDSILCCSGYDLDNMKKSMNVLISKKVDAIILIGSTYISEKDEDNKYITDAALQVPVMMLNGSLNAPNVYGILSDDYTAVYEATLYLIDSGVKDILYFHNSRSFSTKRKMAGFRAAMESRGLFRNDFLQYFQGSHEDIPAMAKHLSKLTKQGLNFNGIIAANDTLAMGAIKYARTARLKMPEDISVIGYDNSLLTSTCEPELTSIDNKLESLCGHLIQTLMDVLNGIDSPGETVFATELVKRGTTK